MTTQTRSMQPRELPWDSERGTRRWQNELSPAERQHLLEQSERMVNASLGIELSDDGTARRRETLPWKELVPWKERRKQARKCQR